jgi:hypothetical protein
LRALDEALCAHAERRWLKVAMVIARALRAAGLDAFGSGCVHLRARRVIALVESGALEAKGNLRRPRWSEVRLPAAT